MRTINNVHKRTIEALVSRLGQSGSFTEVSSEVCYCNHQTHEDGEFDVLGIYKNGSVKYALIVEVKSNNRRSNFTHALHQLDKGERQVRERYGADVRCFKIYAYSDRTKRKNNHPRPYQLMWARNSIENEIKMFDSSQQMQTRPN
jgi:hypothetical protein